LRFVVSAHAAVPALLRLTFGGPAAATSSPATPGAKVLRRGPGTLIVCLPVAGLGPLRTADLAVAVSGPQAAPPRHRSSYLVDVALPQALSLVAMAAEPGIC
jgi:hypothetical protein